MACLAEARELREAGVLTPILLLGYTPTDCAEELLRYGLTPDGLRSGECQGLFRRRPGGRGGGCAST